MKTAVLVSGLLLLLVANILMAYYVPYGIYGRREGFASLANAAATDASMGPYDGVKLSTGNDSAWRYTKPNESLNGPEFVPGDDSLFIFKNNQCKPECCGASFSCGGGCVCTTPQQRQYIAGRGGNRNQPEDSL